ncbi:unnamed protein product [Polarella glacialis]|nr:unnamed protein product [Polarella glacialis]
MDEAACISLWGHDFRPAFRNMWWVREQYPQVPFMALSASMTEAMRMDISEQLCLRTPFVSTLPYFRANLDITCTHKEGFAKDMARIAQAVNAGEAMIVYTSLPSTAVKVAAKLESLLQDQDVQVGVYTGATEKGERERVQSAFDKGEVQVLVATVAFGMGIDKPDIRKIIHYGIPKCMEDYHQQIGRAGRDGLPSSCVILFNNSDWKLWFSKLFTQGYENWDQDDLRNHLESAEHLHQLVVGHSCRHESILSYFGRSTEIELLKSSSLCRCDVCLGRRGEWLRSAKPRDFFREARLVLEAVRVGQELTKGRGASKEAAVQLVSAHRKSALVGVPRTMVDRLWVLRDELPVGRRTKAYSSEIFDMLYGDGYLTRQLKNNRDFRSFVWRMTDFGESALSWGRSVQLLPTRSIRQFEMEPKERKEVEQANNIYNTMKAQVLKRLPYYIAELRTSSSEEDPGCLSDSFGWLASMSDSMKEHAVNAGKTLKMHESISDGDEGPENIHGIMQGRVSAETMTEMAICNQSARTCSKDSATNLCSDLNGVGVWCQRRMLDHVLGQHLQHALVGCELVFDYVLDSRNYFTCVVQLPSHSLRFSSGIAYPSQVTASVRAIINALIALLQIPLPVSGTDATPISDLQLVSMLDDGACQSEAKTGNTLVLLFACMSQHMQRPPRRADVAFTFLLDSCKCYRCVVTLRILGGLQFSTKMAYSEKGNAKQASILHACLALIKAKTGYAKASTKEESRLLLCIAKHMQRPPVEDDVGFTFLSDSNNFWRCVINLHTLGGLEISSGRPQRRKDVAKSLAISRACITVERSKTEHAKVCYKQDCRLLACLAEHMQLAPVEEDVEFRYFLDSNKSWRCVVTLHALEGLEISNNRLQKHKDRAKHFAILRACSVLMKSDSSFAKANSKQESRLLACLAKRTPRPLAEKDVQFHFCSDSDNTWRCVVTLHAFGGLEISSGKPQIHKHLAKRSAISRACTALMTPDSVFANASIKDDSRLLACMAGQMQRSPVEEDVEFRYVLDSNKSWRCVITLHALGGLKRETRTPQIHKHVAKRLAILSACTALMRTESVCAEVGSKPARL